MSIYQSRAARVIAIEPPSLWGLRFDLMHNGRDSEFEVLPQKANYCLAESFADLLKWWAQSTKAARACMKTRDSGFVPTRSTGTKAPG